MPLIVLILLLCFIPINVDAKGVFNLWAISDAHITTDLAEDPPYSPLTNAIDDSTEGGDEGGPAFSWDIAVYAGDYWGMQSCPDASDGTALIAQFTATAGVVHPNRVYGVIGNHDANEIDKAIFSSYVDPLGTATNTSLIDNAMRKYPVSGNANGYAFEVENVLFLMLQDDNFGDDNFGRDCETAGGYPAGRHDQDTYDWWEGMVAANQDKNIITVTHHSLFETTAYTGYDEGRDEGIHGGTTWADVKGSSFVYAIEQCSKDGQDELQGACTQPSSYKSYLTNNNGAIDFWLFGHSHGGAGGLEPGSTFNGRSDIENVHGVNFVNVGALTKFHGPPDLPYSRLFVFTDCSRTVTMKTYLHATGTLDIGGAQSEGWYSEVETTFTLSRAFAEKRCKHSLKAAPILGQ